MSNHLALGLFHYLSLSLSLFRITLLTILTIIIVYFAALLLAKKTNNPPLRQVDFSGYPGCVLNERENK